MVWVRIDDHFDEHPKIVALDDHAFAMFVSGLAYCNRNMTDGFIPEAVGLGKLRWCDGKPRKAIAVLEGVGLWQPVSGGWQVHDFDDYQPSKQQVEDERSRKQAAGQAGGRASAQARASAHGRSNGQARAQAKLKPVPGPGPGPINPDPSPPLTASRFAPSAEFSESEQSVISAVMATLGAFKFQLAPGLWRRILDNYANVDLETEAFKQADWLARKRIKTCSAARYTRWIAKAAGDAEGVESEASVYRAPLCSRCGKPAYSMRGDLCSGCYEAMYPSSELLRQRA